MASKGQEFPVRVTKGTGKDKVTRTAHSPIALVQLETEGFAAEKVNTDSDDSKQGGQKAASNKTASKQGGQKAASNKTASK